MIRNHTTPEGQELGKTLTKCVDPDGCHFVRLGTVACSGRGGCSLRMARNSPLQWGNFCARFPETANRIDAALSSAGYEIRKKEDAR